MFEPRPFSDKSSAQDNLIVALKNRDLVAFEEALADPEVDPDYWYGKPYWSTCLQLAAKTEGCEAFVLALLRAGAGSPRSQRSSVAPQAGKTIMEELLRRCVIIASSPPNKKPSKRCTWSAAVKNADPQRESVAFKGRRCRTPTSQGNAKAGASIGGGGGGSHASGPEATDLTSMEASQGASSLVGAGIQRHSLWSRPSSGWMSPVTSDQTSEQQTVLFWLRDLGRAVREMSEFVTGELRTLADRMEVVEERVAAMERAQQRTNEILRHRSR